MKPTWKYVKLSTVFVADSGWHHDDDATITKLASSLQRHGQLQPLVVRGELDDDSMCTLVEGHKVLGAMLTLGWEDAMVVHLGPVDADAAVRVALALELDFETDYSRLVRAVAPLMERGVPASELAAGSPFDTERLQHFSTLAPLDWSVFGEDTSQARLDWDALEDPAPPPMPPILQLDVATGVVTPLLAPLATVPEGTREEAQVVRITPPLDDTQLHAALDAAAGVLDQHREATTPEMLATAMAEALEDVTEQPQPAPAEQAAAPQGAPETPPGKAAKARPPKVPKAPDAQLGLF